MSFLTTGGVQRRTGMSADAIRWLAKKGRLLSIKVERSPGVFQRLYLEEDVQRFIEERTAQRELGTAAKKATSER